MTSPWENWTFCHKKVTGIMTARSEIKVQSKYWNSITYVLELGEVPLVNCTPSSNFVLNANAVLRSVVPVQVRLCAQRTARWLARVKGAESKSSRPWTTCQGASRTLQTVASWFYTWKSGRQRTNTLSHPFKTLLFSVLHQGGKDLKMLKLLPSIMYKTRQVHSTYHLLGHTSHGWCHTSTINT